jgi:hypothetical protein
MIPRNASFNGVPWYAVYLAPRALNIVALLARYVLVARADAEQCSTEDFVLGDELA